MKRMLKKASVALLSILITVAFMPAFASAASNDDVQSLGKWVESSYTYNGHTYTKRSYVYNDPSILVPKSTKKMLKAANTLPSSYDLRSANGTNVVTAIRNQYPYGTCWAHGSIASAESNLIKKGLADTNIDLSERQLAYDVYNGADSSSDKSIYAGEDNFIGSMTGTGYYYNDGGAGIWQAGAAMARGYGLIDESVSKYSEIKSTAAEETAAISKYRTRSDYSLVNADLFSSPVNKDGTPNTTAMTNIKQALIDNGVVDMSYYSSDVNNNYKFNEDSCSYYYPGDEEGIAANHEVSIVGWDDTYAKTNFKTAPAGNGAWLMRNSWGDTWGDDGYFWISYYDTSLSEPTSFQMDLASNNSYDAEYQYDGVGFAYNMDIDDAGNVVNGANFYTAREDTVLKKIGTWTVAADSTVKVRVYLDPTGSDPTTGTLAYDSGGVAEKYAGYHTINTSDVIIKKDTRFAVVVSSKYTESGSTYYIYPFESKKYENIDYVDGQSAVQIGSGSTWKYMEDSNVSDKFGNALAKAYCKDLPKQTLSGATSHTVKYGSGSFNLGITKTAGDGALTYLSNASGVASVDSSGTVTIHNTGIARITATAATTDTYAATSKTVTINVTPAKESIKSLKAGSKKLTVKWKRDTHATGYKVVIAKNSKFTKGKKTYTVSKYSTTSKTIKKLKKRTKYYVKVRAYKKSGSTTLYGDFSSYKKVRVK